MHEQAVRTTIRKYARRTNLNGGRPVPAWLATRDDATPEFLFDLQADPCELHTLASHPDHRDRQLELSAALLAWDAATPWNPPIPSSG